MPEKNGNHKTTIETIGHEKILSWVSEIAAAYVEHNTIPIAEIPALLNATHTSLLRLASGAPQPEARPEPAVSIRKSVTAEHIICLEDGKKLKMLKRHLKTAYNMTPEQYKERWNLPADYPLVAPNYAKQRSKLAKQIGLGTAKRTGKKAS